MKRKCTIVLGLLLSGLCFAQAPLTLLECHALAEKNYPMLARRELLQQTAESSVRNAMKGYLPRVLLQGKASVQTEVLRFPFELPGIVLPELSADQYQLSVDVQQPLWDGGATRARRESDIAQATVDQLQLATQLYVLRSYVNQVFFSVLLYDELLSQQALFLAEIERNLTNLRAYEANGMANRSDVQSLEVELISAEQKKMEYVSSRKAFLEILSFVIDRPLDQRSALQKPSLAELALSDENQRLELLLFDAQKSWVSTQKKVLKSLNNPRFSLYVQGGYGRPGLNMLEDKFAPYAMGGLRLSWDLSSYYTRKNDLLKTDLRMQDLDVQRESFLFEQRMTALRQRAEVEKMQQLLEKDDEIIVLRESLRKATEKKLENGSATSSDLVRDLHAEQLARQSKLVREIQCLIAIFEYKQTTNTY